jgi:hypothetical protein
MVGGVSLSRLIVGTNWVLGYSHATRAKDKYIQEAHASPKSIADILEVFFRNGVNTVMGPFQNKPILSDAVKEAEDRTGVRGVIVSTPGFKIGPETAEKGWDWDAARTVLDKEAKLGATFCMPHTSTTDRLIDKLTRKIRRMDELCAAMRERGLIPGLSTHHPESIVFADESKLDVETYIAIYNSRGYLMHLEVDWTHRVIQNAGKPVMTIKPLAAGQLRPFEGLAFAWSTLRDKDMVTVGCMSPDEARELIDLSLAMIERRAPDIGLQETRSKETVKRA